jgi:formiminoglutamase
MPVALGETSCYGKGMSGWPNLSDLIVAADADAPVGLVGAPLGVGSVTPGSCDQAPALLRKTLRRIGRYDIESGREIAARIADQGDVQVAGLSIEQATGPIRSAVETSAARHALTLLVGGNNAVTRPGVLGLEMPLGKVGLITLDAHFDMRETDAGLSNGNPVRALIEDGLPGANSAQVGLASFANSAKMHRDAIDAGNLVITIGEVRLNGIERAIERALAHVEHCEAIVVD